MAGKISRLLPSQLEELAAIRQEWLARAVSTEPADRDEAEFGVALAYERAGVSTPKIVWVADPALGAVAASVLLHRRTTTASGRVWAQRRQAARREAFSWFTHRAWGQAEEVMRFPEGDRIEAAVRQAALGLAFTSRAPQRNLGNRTNLSVWAAEQLRIQAATEVWGRLAFWSHGRTDYRRRGVRLALEASGGGPKDLPSWMRNRAPQYFQAQSCLDWVFGQREQLAELALLAGIGRLTGSPPREIEGVDLVARSTGWWWPLEDVAVLCERPSTLAVDRNGRLHAETGPALAYPGGFEAYFWHGRLVPRWAVLAPSAATLWTEPNVEVRRCAIESLGWDRFAADARLALLNECDDPGNSGQRLSLYSVPGTIWGAAANVLVCTNGTVDLDGARHSFGLLVPATVRTALQAAAWGYGLTEKEYAQLERRA